MSKQSLQEELKQSMLAKDGVRTSVLRMLLSAINYYEIQKGGAGYSATDEDIQTVIRREAKQRRDSIEEFKKASRQELVDKETMELGILQVYLPEQMSADEVRKVVEETLTETGIVTLGDMGKLMKALNIKLAGKADMGLVSQIVREKLNS